MKIEVLGSGCTKCKKLYDNVISATSSAQIDAEVVKVQDMEKIIGCGVMATPALVVDGEVKVAGSVPSPAEIVRLLGK